MTTQADAMFADMIRGLDFGPTIIRKANRTEERVRQRFRPVDVGG